MVTYLSIIGRVLRGLEVPVLLVCSGRVAGCYNGLLLWSCGHSKLHPPPQVCCVAEGFPLWYIEVPDSGHCKTEHGSCIRYANLIDS